MIKTVYQLKQAFDNPGDILKAIGNAMKGFISKSFSDQKRGDNNWLPRKVPNMAGIVSDLNEGKTPPSRRFEGRPALVNQPVGGLKDSIGYEVNLQEKSVTIGSGLDYANRMQQGGQSEIKFGSSFKESLNKYYKSNKALFRQYNMGWLFGKKSGDTMTINVPSRPFAIITADDMKHITGSVEHYFETGGQPLKLADEFKP